MKFFVEALKNSFYNGEWLWNHREATGKAVGYFLFIVFLMSLAFSVPLAWMLPKLTGEARTYVTQELPDFRASIKDKQLVIEELPQPYVKTFTEDGANFTIHVDTVSSSTLEEQLAALPVKPNEYTVLISRTGFATVDGSSGKKEIQTIDMEQTDATFSRADLIAGLEKILKVALYPVILFILVFIYGFIAVGKAAFLLLISLLVRLIAVFMKKPVTLGNIFVMGLFAITGPSIIVGILQLVGMPVPFLYSTLLAALLIIAVSKAGKDTSAVPLTPPPPAPPTPPTV